MLEALLVEADHDFVVNNDRGCGATLVLAHQVIHCVGVAGHIAFFEWDSSLREEGRGDVAGRSTGLSEDNDVVHGHFRYSLTDAELAPRNSISLVIFAVFCSMAETEQ